MLGAMLAGCLKGASKEELAASGMDAWYVNHDSGAFPANSNGNSWTADYIACTGDPIADFTNNMAAEQKARAGYEAVMRMCDDSDLLDSLRFLREREIVHFQRFGEALMHVEELKNRRCRCSR